MEFTREEMSRRLETVRTKMDETGIDCMLITGIENFCYFVGVPFSLYQSRRPWCVVIPLESEPVVVCMDGIESTVECAGFFRHVETYRLPVSLELPQTVAQTLKSCAARRVGCEFGLEMRLGLPLQDFNAIVELASSVEFIDASEIIWSLRMIKSAEEIRRMKRACDITSSSRQQVFARVTPGMTEAEVAGLWADLMHEAGGERPSFIYVKSGGQPDLLPSRTKKLEPGDALWLDGGVYVRDYTCDFSRVATLGKPSVRQRKLHQDAVEITDLLLEQVRPGVPVADLARLCFNEVERRGYPEINTAGHAMGMLINEPPLLALWDETVLTEGLVVGVEWGPFEAEGMFVWEQLVQVTHDGYDLLTPEPSSLVVIDV
jgi:Xaa-Pro dipeptidase